MAHRRDRIHRCYTQESQWENPSTSTPGKSKRDEGEESHKTQDVIWINRGSSMCTRDCSTCAYVSISRINYYTRILYPRPPARLYVTAGDSCRGTVWLHALLNAINNCPCKQFAFTVLRVADGAGKSQAYMRMDRSRTTNDQLKFFT
jgi:hypothetical protein